jgi:hypothetical protein
VRASIAALCLAAIGCTNLGPAPRLDSVAPSECFRDEPCALVLVGTFEAPVQVDLDHPSRSSLGEFEVQLVSGDQMVNLPPGAFRGRNTVETRLEAGAAPEGLYLVRLTDPWGRTAELADGLRVRAGVFLWDNTAPARAPPLARMTIHFDYGLDTPASYFGYQLGLDSWLSTDTQTAPADLRVSWSFSPPTAAAPWPEWSTQRILTQSFSLVGLTTVALAVKDTDDDVGYAARKLSIADSMQTICIVTTGTGGEDGATSCNDPNLFGLDGELSLDEAVRISRSPSISETIVLMYPMALTGDPLPVDSVVHLVGTPGATIQRELVAAAGPITFLGVEFGPNGKLTVPNGKEIHVVDSYFHQSLGIVSAGRVEVDRTRFESCVGPCIKVDGVGAELEVSGSSFSGGEFGIDAPSCVWNGGTYSLDLLSNTFSKFTTAIRVGSNCDRPTRIFHQTFHGNEVGIDYLGGSYHELRNNIFTGQSRSAVLGCSVSFANGARGGHLLYRNASDGCLVGDSGTLREDPQYVSTANGDFRLRYESPAVDRAPATGLDVNGDAPAVYLGVGPDYGGRETY